MLMVQLQVQQQVVQVVEQLWVALQGTVQLVAEEQLILLEVLPQVMEVALAVAEVRVKLVAMVLKDMSLFDTEDKKVYIT